MVSHLPRRPGNGDGDGNGLPPASVYEAAVEEYRFQAKFNWSRTQYFLAFNAAILAAGVALSSRSNAGSAVVFVLGFVAAGMSAFATHTSHEYYRAARDRMRRVERELGVAEESRSDTTSTLGGRKRIASVTQVIYLLFGSLMVAHATAAALAIAGLLR